MLMYVCTDSSTARAVGKRNGCEPGFRTEAARA